MVFLPVKRKTIVHTTLSLMLVIKTQLTPSLVFLLVATHPTSLPRPSACGNAGARGLPVCRQTFGGVLKDITWTP